jgi:hypothetical protein
LKLYFKTSQNSKYNKYLFIDTDNKVYTAASPLTEVYCPEIVEAPAKTILKLEQQAKKEGFTAVQMK